MIAALNPSDAFANLQNDGAAFMAHDGGEDSFRVFSRKRESVRVADTGGFYVEQNPPLFGPSTSISSMTKVCRLPKQPRPVTS